VGVIERGDVALRIRRRYELTLGKEKKKKGKAIARLNSCWYNQTALACWSERSHRTSGVLLPGVGEVEYQ